MTQAVPPAPGTDLARRSERTEETAALSTTGPQQQIDVFRFGNVMAKSGYFQDAKEVAQAIVKCQYGLELGIGPARAMSEIYVIQGKPALSAALMASLIQRSQHYAYRVRRLDDTGCIVAFYERQRETWQELGVSTFTLEQAQQAGLLERKGSLWRAYPRNLLWARAMSNGARWYCPGVFGGAVYTPEELSEGIIDVPPAPSDAELGEAPHGCVADGTPTPPPPLPLEMRPAPSTSAAAAAPAAPAAAATGKPAADGTRPNGEVTCSGCAADGRRVPLPAYIAVADGHGGWLCPRHAPKAESPAPAAAVAAPAPSTEQSVENPAPLPLQDLLREYRTLVGRCRAEGIGEQDIRELAGRATRAILDPEVARLQQLLTAVRGTPPAEV